MAAGGGGGTLWIKVLIAGVVLVAAGNGMHFAGAGPGWVVATLFAIGGIAVVFGSCEAMILCIEGIAARLKWNKFVAGTMAGLASNVPELVMLGFVIVNAPRVGFIVTIFTVHVGAMAFGIYSGVLPRDETGHARLPAPLVKLSTDLYACAAASFLTTGAIMLMISTYRSPGEASLSSSDLYAIGASLLFVEVVAVIRLVKRFSVDDPDDPEAEPAPAEAAADADDPPSVGLITFYGVLGLVMSVVGGHAVGDFADTLVKGLAARGYSEMVGALLLAIFASAGAIAMIATAHAKGLYNIALANVSGWINNVPFVVLPVVLIQIALMSQLGVIETGPSGGVLPIDMETTSVFLLAFPPLLILWKAVQDDGHVNWVETATMIAVFGLTLYFLAQRG